MEAYRLYNVVPQLFSFIEDLTNWYIRLNRGRFWGEGISADKIAAYSTLYDVLLELSKLMAPFAPFLSEHLYQSLEALAGRQPSPASVHHCDYPEAEPAHSQPALETAVDRMQQVILLGRQRREEVKIGLRTPLAKMTIVHRDGALLEEMGRLEGYLLEELNVQQVSYSANEAAFIELVAKPNFPLLGRRLGKKMKPFGQRINALSPQEIALLQETGALTLEVDGVSETFDQVEIQVQQQARAGTNTVSNNQISLDLDTTLTPALIRGGYAREVVNRIQRERKERGFDVADRIHVSYQAEGDLALAISEHLSYIMGETLSLDMQASGLAAGTQAQVDGLALSFDLVRVPEGAQSRK